MSIRAISRQAAARASAVATVVIALITALAVPVASLRTVTTVAQCCCPDPTNCHCPDEGKPGSGSCPAIRACHRSENQLVSPELPGFVSAELAIAAAPTVREAVATFVIRTPHVEPAPARPDAPS